MTEASNTQDYVIGQAIARLREARGWSMRKLAREMREDWAWTPTTASRVEQGLRPVRLAEAPKLAALLDASVESLLVDPLTRRQEEIRQELKHVGTTQIELGRRAFALEEERKFFGALTSAHKQQRAKIDLPAGRYGFIAANMSWATLKDVLVYLGIAPSDVDEILRKPYDGATADPPQSSAARDEALSNLDALLRGTLLAALPTLSIEPRPYE